MLWADLQSTGTQSGREPFQLPSSPHTMFAVSLVSYPALHDAMATLPYSIPDEKLYDPFCTSEGWPHFIISQTGCVPFHCDLSSHTRLEAPFASWNPA
ncbi:hypothetical protein DPMN_163688 [Dreissena polymorpha]|uniref:Uncharacterized protein n=1 Tax=Dreissena polymorpha TaxID=45954 RepID=A0A9D4EX52_DREPO|nr:hypothetical protein DPMN_163688 [Dreissena polymorpha]